MRTLDCNIDTTSLGNMLAQQKKCSKCKQDFKPNCLTRTVNDYLVERRQGKDRSDAIPKDHR